MASTVQEVDNGLYRIAWLLEIKSSLEIKRLNFRLDRLPPNASYDLFAFCSFNSEHQQQQQPRPEMGRKESSRAFEFRFRFWEVDAEKKLDKDSSRYARGSLGSVWVTVNGGRRHDLKRFPGGSWNSEGFDVLDADGGERPAWLVEVRLWLQFEAAVGGEARLLDQLAELLASQSNCDVRLVFSDGEHIGAHALILAARSPVFDAMFRHDTMEAQSRTVLISDVPADAFRSFLHYVYRGRLAEPLTDETAQAVYMAADKYAVDDLKAECVDWLLANVRVENAVNVLAWAHVHSVAAVKEAALDFVARHGKQICPLPDWEELIKNYPDLSLVASRRMMDNMVLVQSK